MNGGSRCWASLPADALAYIINECGLCQSDIAAIRLVCVHWRSTTNSHLKSLAPACTSLEQVAGIAERFPFLTNCDLTRCDTRLVGHASLCRDASARLSTLLAALSRMPSLTSLHISDTFSERMGQKHWASLVCAQALVDVAQPSAIQAASSEMAAVVAPVSLEGPSAAVAASSAGTSNNLITIAAAVATSSTPGVGPTTKGSGKGNGAATTMVRMGVVAMAAIAASSPCLDKAAAAGPVETAATAAARGGSACPTCGHGTPEALSSTPSSASRRAVCEGEDFDLHDAVPGDCEEVGAASVVAATACAAGSGAAACDWATDTATADDQKDAATPCPGTDSVLVLTDQSPVKSTQGQEDVPAEGEVEAGAAAEELAAAPTPGAQQAGVATPLPLPPSPPPPPLVMSAAELADPGIKSFARAISRPGATHQHAFWLPDWCGRLAGLQELHIRGRQRPAAGLPPCLLWLHAGRTAPQLTSLSLVRLSLVTLPEQLQHLTALTRLVAQDCSLSLMPRGLAAGLSRLQYMDLSLNGLTALPPDFTQLTALKHLDLQRNKLVTLPADIGRLSSVTCLLLNNNQLRQLPPSLAAMRAVEVLSCSYNWLGGMGPSLPLLCSLPRLKRLELACVSDVRCRLVPPQELRLLAANLTHLDLAANNLVPSDVLGTLTSVRSLVLSDCGLLAVPPWVRRLAPSLQHLDLSNNSLSELPPWLSACTRLRYLSIAHNRLSIRVPPSVLEQMPQLEVVESE